MGKHYSIHCFPSKVEEGSVLSLMLFNIIIHLKSKISDDKGDYRQLGSVIGDTEDQPVAQKSRLLGKIIKLRTRKVFKWPSSSLFPTPKPRLGMPVSPSEKPA